MTFWIAFISNLRVLFGLSAGLAVLAFLMSGITWLIHIDEPRGEKTREACSKVLWRAVPVMFICGTIAALPDAQDLWHARVALLKYELASPENVQKGVDEITRVTHVLECKYLGCSDDKKKEGTK